MAVHGTGTPLGDPIEMGALGGALSMRTSKTTTHHDIGSHATAPLTLGAPKSCFGHTEGTAGITGVLHVLMSMTHKVGNQGNPFFYFVSAVDQANAIFDGATRKSTLSVYSQYQRCATGSSSNAPLAQFESIRGQ